MSKPFTDRAWIQKLLHLFSGAGVKKLDRVLLGGARNPFDQSIFRSLSLLPFFAWVGLGADGLSSSGYGPEASWHVLNNPLVGQHPHLGLFVALGTVITVFVLCAAYSQIIELFPSGGGGYLAASKLLNPTLGMFSGCALLVGYVLTIAVSVAAGVDAIFSFLPPGMLMFKFPMVVVGILLLTLMNLRGVKESVNFMVPIFLVFVATHAFAILWAFFTHVQDIPQVAVGTAADVTSTASQVGWVGLFILVMKAYSMGAGTYTGIEAVSNGLNILREPRVKNGKRTMHYMAISLSMVAVGLFLAYLFYNVQQAPGRTLNASLFDAMTKNWGLGGDIFVWVTLFSEAALLFIAAQTGFLGGPRVLANMALDHWLPSRFAMLSDRLVTQNGVIYMSALALVISFVTHGSVEKLMVIYTINVFITFSFSMLSMVRHWWHARLKKEGGRWHRPFVIGLGGFGLSFFILMFMVVSKFHEGGWATLLVTGTLILISAAVQMHYHRTRFLLRRLDNLVSAARKSLEFEPVPETEPVGDPKGKTAVLLVNGWNGLGLHTLFNIQRLYSNVYRNFVFVHIGVVDAGNFKGVEDMEALQQHMENVVGKYVEFMRRHGTYAEGYTGVGTDVVSGTLELAPKIMEKYAHCVFYGGQLVFPEETAMTRFLHNNVVFALQRRFYMRGIPFMILPIRVF